MMRRTHKILAATIATIAAVASLAGCTPSSAPAAGGESSGTKTLTVWHYYSVPGQTKGLDSLGQDFEAKHDGVTVKNVYVPFDQLTNKLVQAAGTKSGPDVVVYNAADTYTLDKAGAIAPMDSWWNDFADKDQFPDSVIQKVDGKTLGVQGFVNLIGLWYNKDILDQLGVKPPTTFAELEKDLALAKAAGKEGITLTGKPNSEGEWQAFPWLSRAGWDYAKPEQKPLEDAFSLMQDWTSKGYLTKEASTWDQTVPFQQFSAGNTAFAVNGNWQIASAKQSAKFNYGVVPIPVGDKGSIYLGGEAQNIGAFSKNKELAQQYLEQEFFSKQGELTLLKAFGSIPARADVAEDPQVKDDPILSVFSSIVAKNGHASPDRAIPSKNVATVLQTVGESWSAAIAGTGTPKQISHDLLNKLKPLLKQ
ncbi:extracellular solute-binding protein [Curtobacterium flaccumfaciens]|uniref:sugar ABC transporter substrate-binding protein n=1 Tax=Curtobacterium flaccumfaciens TaxID=2035 RepID=UPI00188A4836|nr:extracellular solute-binding protein [Curtobacterium flaccumfaciens]MBF4595714.1 extracellular solute-binding protein [Curtobacterium flaccumfaciens]